MDEATFITASLKGLREELSKIPEVYKRVARDTQREIDSLCEEAGILGAIRQKEESLKDRQQKLQSKADLISGKISALEALFRKFHLAPIPEGITHMYGLELAPLDPETRLIVMHGHNNEADVSWIETVTVLGGDPSRRDWDGTEPEEEQPPIDTGFTFPPHHPLASSAPKVEWPNPAIHSSQDLDPSGDQDQEE